MRTGVLDILMGASLASLLGCKAPGPPAFTTGGGPVVATVGGGAITRAQFEQHLKEQSPFIRARYTTLDRKKEFLDGMIRFRLLADEARHEGLDKDPEVVSTLDKLIVQKLVHLKFGEEGAQALPEADLRGYYQQHLDEFVKPERLRLQIIELADAREAARARDRLATAAGKHDLSAFGTYASAHSLDAATRARNGDTEFQTLPEIAATYGQAVADAAAKLTGQDEMSGVVEGKGGAYLVRIIGRQAALSETFEQARPALQSRLWHERQNKAFETYVQQLREQAHVTVDDAELAKADATAPDLSGNGAGLRMPMRTPVAPPVAATPPGAWDRRRLRQLPPGYHPPSAPPPGGQMVR